MSSPAEETDGVQGKGHEKLRGVIQNKSTTMLPPVLFLELPPRMKHPNANLQLGLQDGSNGGKTIFLRSETGRTFLLTIHMDKITYYFLFLFKAS